MRVVLCLVMIIGGPIYVFNSITRGLPDPGQTGLVAFLTLCAFGGLYVAYRKLQVQKGREDFYLSQRKK